MNEMQRKVWLFHQAFMVDAPNSPRMPSEEVRKLREKLIEEELQEFREANGKGDLVAAIDAIGDLAYVVFGAAIAYGIDLEPFFNEIHRSNMSKGWKKEDGDPRAIDPEINMQRSGPEGVTVCQRRDGKVVKSPSYTPADIAGVLAKEMPEKHTCPLRIGSWGPWKREENLDLWQKIGSDRVCNFCGSLHPDEFVALCQDIVDGKQRIRIDLNDHCDKIYLNRKDRPNASYGAIKFKVAHLPIDKRDLVNAALKIGHALFKEEMEEMKRKIGGVG